jgi:phosphatidylglycerol:prolipoprotein diacylglycerol transferase
MRPVMWTLFGLDFFAAPAFAGLASLVSFLYFRRRNKDLGLNADDFWAVIASLAAGVFTGAVLFYAVAYGGGLARNAAYLLRNRTVAGGSFLGTYLGAAAAAWLCCRLRRLDFPRIGDVLGAAAPLGLIVMRVGCLLNGCCWGGPTSLPWGLRFPSHPHSAIPTALRGVPIHPTQVYEMLGCAAIFLFVDRVARPRVAAGLARPGDGLAASVGLYALLRFCVDFVRAGDVGVVSWAGLSLAQWVALAAMGAAAGRLARSRA